MATAAPIIAETTDWFSAVELADLALPGIPANKRMINRLAQDERWQTRQDANGEPLVRPRKGRGGGVEYHVSLLPGITRLELVKRGLSAPAADLAISDPAAASASASAHSWAWYERQKNTIKAKAEMRLAIIREMELLEQSGSNRTAAISAVCGKHNVSSATMWNWLNLIDGVPRTDWLPALAPRTKGGGKAAEMHPDLWEYYKSDRLRNAQPTAAACYRRTKNIAEERGLPIPSARTFARKFDAEIPQDVQIYCREGKEASRQAVPALRRSVTHLGALEIVNLDGHSFDVFVNDGVTKKPYRPMMIAIQDVRSSKILAWRLDRSENVISTRLVFADLFRNFGIPRAVTTDNGSAFASKQITGGTKSRFRGKIRDEDPAGLLVSLGIDVHFALPGRGQSKPIERAFRDMCDDIARAPAMEGAYTGNSVANKPANYGSRSIPIAEFEQHVAHGIAEHNARKGRTGRDYDKRSFDQVFNEVMAMSAVKKANTEQLRRALLAVDQKMVNRRTGVIELYGNRYYGEVCRDLRGQKVTVRFDPEYLHDGLHLYAHDGPFIGTIPLLEDGIYDNQADALRAKKMEAEHRRLTREAVKHEELLTAAEMAAMQARQPTLPTPEPAVTQLVHHRTTAGGSAAVRKPIQNPEADSQPAPSSGESIEDRLERGRLRLVKD